MSTHSPPLVSPCPDPVRWRLFVNGQLTERDAANLETHLGACNNCQAAVQALRGETLVPDLQPSVIESASPLLPTTAMKPAESHEPAAAALAPPQAHDELGRLAHYRVLKELGKGGMGAVYLAEDTQLLRKVALKVMLPKYAADAIAKERFVREARAAAAVKHDNVITIYQVGEERGTPFIAMEFLQGLPLDRWLHQNPRPSLPQVLRIGREIAEGLAAAHGQGLIHRDIKPANLWLEAPKGRIKVLDFGLARPQDDDTHLTGSGVTVGTPAFMSPEQARGSADFRSDLFSLGCVLYRLCTGNPPFRGKTSIELLTALAVDTPAPIVPQNPEVPPAVESLVFQLLEKDPSRRTASAQAVADYLRAIERGTRSIQVAHAAIPVAAPAEFNPWEELTEASEPPAPAAVTPLTRSRKPLLIAGLVVVAAIIAAVLLTRTSKGTIKIDTVDARVPVIFIADDGSETIIDPAKSPAAQLAPGHYRIRLEDGATKLRVVADSLTLKGGETVIIEVRDATAAKGLPRLPDLKRGPVDDEWIKRVGELQPDEQVGAVVAKLKELNLGFNRVVYLQQFKNGVVTEFGFDAAEVSDLSPLRALPRLTHLECRGSSARKSRLNDLRPMATLPLVQLVCTWNSVSDLSPLRGMPLQFVHLVGTEVADLSPLTGAPLSRVAISSTPVTDLSPLSHCPVAQLECNANSLRDFSPCRTMPLIVLLCPDHPGDVIEPLRAIKTLQTINAKPSAEFWKDFDARQDAFEKWVNRTSGLSAQKQIAAVARKLQEHNPGFSGHVEPLVEGTSVVRMALATDQVFDLSPLRALTELREIRAGSSKGTGQVRYLDPLSHLQKLRQVLIAGNDVRDLSPLSELQLTHIDLWRNPVRSLEPLRNTPLEYVWISETPIKTLAPLQGKTLQRVHFKGTNIDSVQLLRDMPLREVVLDYVPQRGDRTVLGSIKTLQKINDQSAVKFFEQADDFEAWVRTTAALEPVKQLEAVNARMRERNPGAVITRPKQSIAGNAIDQVKVVAPRILDLSPLRALPALRDLGLGLSGPPGAAGKVDLSPLIGSKLTGFSASGVPLGDLAPLSKLPLENMYLPSTGVEDLSSLAGMPLGALNLENCPVRDLSPLARCPLHTLQVPGSRLVDLAPVKDLDLKILDVRRTGVRDLSPCAKMPLEHINFDWYPGASNVEPLRAIQTLKTINGRPASEFWKEVKAQLRP